MTSAFLALVNASISAGWLVLAVLLLRYLFRKAPKWMNLLLWGIVGLRLVCPITLESPWSLIPSAETISPEIMTAPVPSIHSGVAAINRMVNPVIAEFSAPTPAASANPLQIGLPLAAAVWGLGMIGLWGYAAIRYGQLRRKLRAAVCLQDNIFQSECVQTPFVLGLFRPKIYLPFAMRATDRAHVMAHEQAHIQRKDHWWKPLGFLLMSVYWFHPLMIVAYAGLCRDIEQACDEKVIRPFSDQQRADYAQTLLVCSLPRRWLAACPLAFGEVGLKTRVKSILRYKKPTVWIIGAAILLCMIVGIGFLTNPMTAEDVVDPPFTPARAVASPEDGLMQTVYVSNQCLYMNPLSSVMAFGGDSGYRYRVGANAFEWIDREEKVVRHIDVLKWEWQPFPYTEEEWAALYIPGRVAIPVHEMYHTIRYQPLEEGQFLLNMDAEIWLVDLRTNPQMGTFLWSIYQLAPEFTTGGAGWTDTPQNPYFRFSFDLDYDELSAFCGESQLIDRDGGDETADYNLELPHGNALYWSPLDAHGNAIGASTIHFTAEKGGMMTYAGTIYIIASAPGTYHASVVGTGLCLAMSEAGEGGAIVRAKTAPWTFIKPRLTLEDVVRLAAKGDALTWTDFEPFESIDVGFGLYILRYEIDDDFALMIGGVPSERPMYIRLVDRTETAENWVDIRTADVVTFIQESR